MVVLSKDTEVLKVDEIEVSDDFVVILWGQYRRVMTLEAFNLYTVTLE